MKTLFAALLAGIVGCVFVLPVSAVQADKLKAKALYSFCSRQNCTDGAGPRAGVVDMKGMLYGTTPLGGAYGYGAVFAVDSRSGTEAVVYSFCRQKSGDECLDGAVPYGGLIAMKGKLYGTTTQGGDAGCDGEGCGIVFAIDPKTGTETVLHNFAGGTDGSFPRADLIDMKGTLYGTTYDGGTGCGGNGGCGTVFSLDPGTGAETVLHSFGDGNDGQQPAASLIAVNGVLYGTTRLGGYYGAGAVFSVDPGTGSEKVRYSFCAQFACPDGTDPQSGLIDMNGVLYGTTVSGGSTGCTANSPPGCGTVFAFDPKTGTETVVYTFQGNSDGQWPFGNLIAVDGKLFGTTEAGGGTGSGCDGFGCGTVFSVVPNTGTETLSYTFCGQNNCSAGADPQAGLIDANGTLYGTSAERGGNNQGSVFALTQKR